MQLKYIFLISTLFFVILSKSKSQSCLPGGISFSTQAQIDDFSVNHPGCTNIIGSVSIGSNITNLGGLSQITTIGGAFTMFNNSNLQNFQGLNQLTSIGDRFQIVGNTNLQNFSGLSSLSTINGYVEIINNINLISFSGLDNLVTVGFYFVVHNCPITNLGGLNSLENIGSTFGGSFSFSQTSLQNFSGLNSIEYINGLTLIGNPLLTDITNLNNCNYGGYYTYIQNNPLLTSLNGLAGMVYSAGVSITGNTSLQNLSGLEGLASCCDFEPLQISSNSSLLNLNGLNSLNSADQLLISNNSNLNSLSSLSSLQNTYEIIISNNTLLSSLAGLENIDINNLYALSLQNNAQLSYCHLTNICDFLTNFPGASTISGNLTTCATLNDVEIQCNALPINLITFSATKKATDAHLYWQTTSEINNYFFEIEYSKNGFDFNTIGRKEGAGGSNALIDYHFVHEDVIPGMHYYRLKQVDYDGQFTYSDIKSLLIEGVGEDVSIYPNPANNILNINGAEGLNYTLYDLVGRSVSNGQISDDGISIDHLRTGMYYLHLDNDTGNTVYKIWKE